jgi:ubiquinone/menaquinone biosynthesis C-methylase UbiE
MAPSRRIKITALFVHYLNVKRRILAGRRPIKVVIMSDEYLATGFIDVDGADNTDAYSNCLSLLDSLPYFKRYKQQTYELLELGPDDRLLDAGCGLGDDVFRMAEMITGSGLIVGVDSSTKLIKKAISDKRNSKLSVEFHVGDLTQLQFENESFSRCRIDRVLQHIPEPSLAISELVRVLETRGLLVAYDNDWGTFSITSRNKPLTQILENAWCDSFTNSWIGRDLQELFVNAGLSMVTIYPSTSVISDYDIADKVYNLEQTVKRAIENGNISRDEGSEWISELLERAKSGCFAAVLTAYTVVGQKR